MEIAWMRMLVLTALFILCSWSVACRAQYEPSCEKFSIAAGQRVITPAIVVGDPGEHLLLRGTNPSAERATDSPYGRDDGYVVTGDRVDLISHCDHLSYVRFHGKERVSTGWVDAWRLPTVGDPYVPLPPGAPALCSAAQDMLNAGTLHPAATARGDRALAKKVEPYLGFDNSVPEVAPITVAGRPMKVVLADGGGTAHSYSALIFSAGLDRQLSPPDADSRRIENDGTDVWGFGLNESLVFVRHRPMIMENERPESSVTLSSIDRQGDIMPTCVGSLAPVMDPLVQPSFDVPMCHALFAEKGLQTMADPLPGESLVLSHVPDEFRPEGQDKPSPLMRRFHNETKASGVTYRLVATGTVDLDNSGHPRRVGLLSFFDGDSSAGDGRYQSSWFRPVYLDDQGRADPDDPANVLLSRGIPEGMHGGKLITHGGMTYLALAPDDDGRIGEIWQFGKGKPRQVCGFRLTQFQLRVVTADDSR